jgi:phenylalanyl-tRNA synthetase beta chain
MPEMAMNRLSQLASEIVKGNISEETLDNYPKDIVRTSAPYKIGVSLKEVNKVLGSNMKDKDVTNILDRLSKYAGFKWEKVSPLKKVLEEAKKYESVPYKYGASITFDAPNYFDCSSFVSYVFINAGIALPRRTVDQFVYGEEVKDLSPGDIVFSKSDKSEEEIERLNTKQSNLYTESVDFMKGTKISEGVSHNGIYLGDGKVAHAAGNSHKGKIIIEDLETTAAFKNIVGYRRIILNDDDRYVVEIPHERLDLRAGPGYLISGNKEDLIEEIGRIYGYTNIQSDLPKNFPFKPKVNKSFYYSELIKDILIENGFSEVITYSFQNEGKVKLANPLSSDKKYLRGNLSLGLGKSMGLNSKNSPLLGTEHVKIFEIGKVFMKDKEEMHLGIALSNKEDFVTIVDLLEKKLGQKLKENISNSVWEINLETLIEKLPGVESYNSLSKDLSQINKFKHISPYPFVLRDIAVWVPKEITSDSVLEEIQKESGELLVNTRLFDTYKGDDRTSYAFRLTFQSDEKTLSDSEINEVMKEVENSLNNKANWEVR